MMLEISGRGRMQTTYWSTMLELGRRHPISFPHRLEAASRALPTTAAPASSTWLITRAQDSTRTIHPAGRLRRCHLYPAIWISKTAFVQIEVGTSSPWSMVRTCINTPPPLEHGPSYHREV